MVDCGAWKTRSRKTTKTTVSVFLILDCEFQNSSCMKFSISWSMLTYWLTLNPVSVNFTHVLDILIFKGIKFKGICLQGCEVFPPSPFFPICGTLYRKRNSGPFPASHVVSAPCYERKSWLCKQEVIFWNSLLESTFSQL